MLIQPIDYFLVVWFIRTRATLRRHREALRPGKWLIHCHINHHTTNNNVETDGAGGLTMIIDVAED